MAAYLIGFVTAYLGCSQLRQEHGWWALTAGFVVFFAPFLGICLVHGSRLRRIAAR